MILTTLARLGPRCWVDIVYVGALSAFIEVRLRTGSLADLASGLGVPLDATGSASPPGGADAIALSPVEARRLNVAWRVLRRRPFNGTCLRRALVGGHILRRHDPRLHVGVRRVRGGVEAHAWVAMSGVSLDPDAGREYHVMKFVHEEPKAR